MDVVMQEFDFASLPRPRGSYAKTLASYRLGMLTCGLLWEIAERDEVFRAFIIKNGVPKP